MKRKKKTGLSNPHANPRNYWDEAEILFALHHSEQFSPGWSNKFMVPIFEQTNRWWINMFLLDCPTCTHPHRLYHLILELRTWFRIKSPWLLTKSMKSIDTTVFAVFQSLVFHYIIEWLGGQLAVGKCWENGFEVRLRCGWGTVESVIYVWVSVEYALSIRWVPVKPQLSVGWAYAEPQLRFVFFLWVTVEVFYGLRSGWGKSACSGPPQSIVFMVWVGFEWILSRIWVDFE